MDDRVYGEPLHQPPELFMRQSLKVTGTSGPDEPAGFNTFIEEQETITFPKQSFDLGRGMPAEQEEGVGNEQGYLVPFLDDGSEGIYPVAQIGKTADEIDTGKCTWVSILKHSVPP